MNNRMYLSLAIPLTISTMSTPLLGAVDTAVVGKLSDPAYIGGVAVGTIIFNTMYWLLDFFGSVHLPSLHKLRGQGMTSRA